MSLPRKRASDNDPRNRMGFLAQARKEKAHGEALLAAVPWWRPLLRRKLRERLENLDGLIRDVEGR